MKKVLTTVCMAALMTSCAIVQQTTVTNVANYSTFNENGVYATESNTIPYEYRPIGSVTSITTASSIQGLDMAKAFKGIAEKVIVNGGNGIINLNINITSSKDSHYMTVTGMAVQINDKRISEFVNTPVTNETKKEATDPNSNPHLQRYMRK